MVININNTHFAHNILSTCMTFRAKIKTKNLTSHKFCVTKRKGRLWTNLNGERSIFLNENHYIFLLFHLNYISLKEVGCFLRLQVSNNVC